MSIKKLSKIGITLFLAASFSMPFSFPARADFTSTDSNNLRLIQENTSNTVTRLGTIINSYLADIKSDVATIDTNVQNIKTAVANTITTTLNGISTTLTSIKGYVDGLEGYVDGLEGKLDNIYARQGTINSNIITAGSYLESIDGNLSSTGTDVTAIYNLLNTNIFNEFESLRKNILLINDNIMSPRANDSEAINVTITDPMSLTSVSYTLKGYQYYSISVNAQTGINITRSTRYANFRGFLHKRLENNMDLITSGFNLAGQYLLSLYNLLDTDLEYIGTELHLTYQLLDAFKSANHTDIIAFKDANHTDITAFKTANHNDFLTLYDILNLLGLRLAVLNDNMTTNRVRNTEDDITVYFNNQSTTYTLKSFTALTSTYTNGQFNLDSEIKYGTTLGILSFQIRAITESFRNYFRYLNDVSVANQIRNNVAALDTNLTNYSNAEQQIQNRVQNAISTFIPDTQLFNGFVAIAWCSQYLQKVYVALGSYGTVIMIGLLLGVCMQFIGYFRYKY